MIKIQPQYLSLSTLLSKRLFVIPEYQRAYSWGTKQRKDLFNDILKTGEKGESGGHFMAAVVCLRKGTQILGTDEFQKLDIVDGQQRLTTLIILLKAIALKLKVSIKNEDKLKNELEELLVKAEADALLLLQTNHDSSHHFANYLRNGSCPKSNTAKTVADRELLSAVEDCDEFVEQWLSSNKDLLHLVALLKNRLFFLLHEIEDEQAVYTVFEVLNSRGLDVSWLDRLKSILMGLAYEQKNSNEKEVIRELHRIWRDIYVCIGLRQGMSTEALRFAATLVSKNVPSRALGEEDSVEVFRQDATNAANILQMAKWLLEVTEVCNKLNANVRINAVTRIAQARLLAVAIYLRNDIKEQEREALIVKWEKVTFRIYGMMWNDARTRVGDYVRLAWRVKNEKITAREIADEISAIGKDFPIDKAVDHLRKQNCYDGWEQELRYFLFRYEESLSRKAGQNFSNEQWNKIWMASPSESIEHVMPQSIATEKLKHRLGNLVLLPPRLNSTLQDKKPIDKIEAYRKTGLLIVDNVVKGINKTKKWSAQSINSREEELLKWAQKEWAD